MKKVITLIAAGLIMLSFCACSTSAQPEFIPEEYTPAEDFRYRINDDDTASIEAYLGDDDELYIPPEIDGHPVISIAPYAFSNDEISYVYIPGSITRISDGAFYDCIDLEEIYMSEGITKIGSEAFKNCNSLESVIFPNTLKELGAEAFYGCDDLEEVVIPKGLEYLGEDCFEDCDELKDFDEDDYRNDDEETEEAEKISVTVDFIFKVPDHSDGSEEYEDAPVKIMLEDSLTMDLDADNGMPTVQEITSSVLLSNAVKYCFSEEGSLSSAWEYSRSENYDDKYGYYKYWQCILNGEVVTKPLNTVEINDGDEIEFIFTEVKTERGDV